jgi:hypothetical protein
MASQNEKNAAKLNMTLKEYKVSSYYKKDKKGGSSSEKDAKKGIKKYYKEKESDVKQKAKTETERYQEDLRRVMSESGIVQTRATEDYIRNIGNLDENKAADVADIAEYVKTQRGRTQEDLDLELAKESRRYSIEQDRINEDLASRGMTFSERRPEQLAQEEGKLATEGIQREANRSFQDIARYEAVKNRDIEIKYGQQATEEGIKKTRTIEDILNEQQAKEQRIQRGTEDIAFGKAQDIRDIGYGLDSSIYGIETDAAAQSASLDNKLEENKVFG